MKIPVRQLSEPEVAERFSIRSLTAVLSGYDMVHEMHRHEYYFILALDRAIGDHLIDFVSYQVNDHAVFFIRPGQVHRLMLGRESTGYLVEFNADFFSSRERQTTELLRKASSRNHYILNVEGSRKIQALLSDVLDEYSGKKAGYNEVIRANLEILFVELARQERADEKGSASGDSYSRDKLDSFFELLEKHIAEHKQVSHYADMLHLTPYQLNAITKELLGKTSSELISDHIILEIKRNLLATSDQVNQIAFQLGYEDVSYFIRFFKKHTGYSPEAFRQNFR